MRARGPEPREAAYATDQARGQCHEKRTDEDENERAQSEDADRAAGEQLLRRRADTRLPEREREHEDEDRGDDRERSERCQADLAALPALSAPQLWRSSIAALKIVPHGLATPWPAMSGAEPWIGS